MSAEISKAVLDALPEEIAVVDRNGRIVQTNAAWILFSDENGGLQGKTGVGADYLEVCDRAAQAGITEASLFSNGLYSVLSGKDDSFSMEACVDTPPERRWFRVTARSLKPEFPDLCAIIHSDRTAEKKLGRRLEELKQDLKTKSRPAVWTSFLGEEIFNPLNAALLRAQFQKRLFASGLGTRDFLLRSCNLIEREVRGAVHLIHEVLDSTRSSQPDRLEKIRVKDFLEEIAALFSDRTRGAGGPLRLRAVDANLEIESHPMNLSHILLGVLLHAFETMKGAIQLDAKEQKDHVLIRISGRAQPTPGPCPEMDIEIAKKLISFENGEIRSEKSPSGAPSLTLVIPKKISQ